MSYTGFAFYIAVRCGFDKHLYLTSCNNTAYNHPSDNITEIRYFGTVQLLRPKTKQSPIMLTWSIWTSCPQLSPASFFARETCTPYTFSGLSTFFFSFNPILLLIQFGCKNTIFMLGSSFHEQSDSIINILNLVSLLVPLNEGKVYLLP